jgi:hypothetical protein
VAGNRKYAVETYPPKEEASYWAGLFDGEGCVGIIKYHGRIGGLKVSLGQKGTLLPYLMRGKFGGTVSVYKAKQFFLWNASGKDALRFLQWISSHSILKKAQIDFAITYYKEYVNSRGFYGWGRREPADKIEERLEQYNQLRILKEDSYRAV